MSSTRPTCVAATENQRAFETILLNEVLPLVRQHYRVATDAASTAILGLSLGGEFGMYVGLNHPDVFGSIATLSGSFVPASFATRFEPAIGALERRQHRFRLIWIASSTGDIFFQGNKRFAERLQVAGLKPEFRERPGPHVMPLAREELAEVLTRLFRD
jgi:enterochelin esterase-like enzyme